jgi:hypothetical protein
MDDDTEAYVITEVLQSNEITVSAKDEKGGQVKIDFPSIKGVVGGDVSVSAKDAANTALTFVGNDPVTFGFKAFLVAFDGRWRITGVEPGAGMAFAPGENPVILRQGTVAFRSA